MNKSKKTDEVVSRDRGSKHPFFARYLVEQELASASAGKTLKYPSDSDDEDF